LTLFVRHRVAHGTSSATSAATALRVGEDRVLVRATRRPLITDQHILVNEGVIT
jgi:hypothetical protein